ncbi:MAG TPA: hypothetical protein VGL35_01975 [Rhizomicrobium sp.]|jgi:hypothetical protein
MPETAISEERLLQILAEVHGVRLDWLQRLVLSKARGARKIRRRDLAKILNVGLVNARVDRLEDPIEDLFCEFVMSDLGSFRIFTGQWERAGAYTQTVIEAFLALPDGKQKEETLASAVALLKISDALAERASVSPEAPVDGTPGASVALPIDPAIRKIARLVRFADDDLALMGIAADDLTPFLLAEEWFPYVSDRHIGETPLDFHPLMKIGGGVIVANPGGISLALRSLLISTAKDGGLVDDFEDALMRTQEKNTNIGHFWPLRNISLSPRNRFGMRASMVAYDEGRLLHVIQLPPLTADFPQHGFAAIRKLSPEAHAFLTSDIRRFWAFGKERPDCRAMTSVILFSGWGGVYGLESFFDAAEAPAIWQHMEVSFGDVATLAVVEDGEFQDLSRLIEQERRLETAGFEFQNANGLLNLFGFWRLTGGNLIPEHMLEIQPPTFIGMPTDTLLKPRIEAARLRDVRKLPMPDNTMTFVERLDRSDDEELKPVYVSATAIVEGVLLGAVVVRGRVWWVESRATARENRDWCYRLWNAVLQWLFAVGPDIIDRFGTSFAPVALISLVMPDADAFTNIDVHRATDVSLAETVSITPTTGGATVSIDSAWVTYVRNPKNDAEVELVSAILAAFSGQAGAALNRPELSEVVRAAVGSEDWRHIHARQLLRPEDRLAACRLVPPFKPVPRSAHYLVKCGSIWSFRSREEGQEIDGAAACKVFLLEYREAMLNSLIADIRRFNREALCFACGRRYQSARIETARWRFSIRALRAIHGTDADLTAMDRGNESNGVQRGAKIIAEIAACEAPSEGGYKPSVAELDELFAKALLIFGNSQLLGLIGSELILPKIRISPAGDLLIDRAVTHEIVRPGAKWQNRQRLDEASEAYLKRDESDGENAKGELDSELRAALEAEYCAPAELIVNLQFAMIDLAVSKNVGVLALKRSEIAMWLTEQGYGSDIDDFLSRLTLDARSSWNDLKPPMQRADVDFDRFDRPWSLINRPLLALDQSEDPFVLVIPMMVSDSIMYCVSGLLNGSLNNNFWVSHEARRFAGIKGEESGHQFEDLLAEKFRAQRLEVIPRCNLSAVLNQKVPPELGNIDALVISQDKKRVWAIEAKNLRVCRTEAEVAMRMSEYKGRMKTTAKGKQKPDKMLRHIRRVEYLRQHRSRLSGRLDVVDDPEVHGLLVVNGPQPMNFKTIDDLPDGRSVDFESVDKTQF